MKKPTSATPSSAAPVSGSPSSAVPTPVLDLKLARAVPPYRHSKPARTVAYHQPAGDAGVHLFSVTGTHIATVSAETASASVPPAPAVPPSVPPSSDSPSSSEVPSA